MAAKSCLVLADDGNEIAPANPDRVQYAEVAQGSPVDELVHGRSGYFELRRDLLDGEQIFVRVWNGPDRRLWGTNLGTDRGVGARFPFSGTSL
jgi:hypothetical protein